MRACPRFRFSPASPWGALLATLALAAGATPVPAALADDDARREFAAMCERLTQGDNAYFGRAIVDELEGRLTAGDQASVSGVLLRVRLGYELLRLGRLERAIATLEQAMASGEILALRRDGELMTTALSTLAMAHLQLAEDRNCIDSHSAESCILPIRGGGVHRAKEEARTAGDLYLRLLELRPADIQARWLHNLARMLSGDYPDAVPEPLRLPAAALESEAEFPRWANLAPGLGVDAFDHGGGAVMDDFDGDGLLDLVSSSWDPCEPLRAFRNDGRGGFEDVAVAWGLDGQLGGLNIRHADYDGDGRLDLLVLRGAWLGEEGRLRNSLLRNEAGQSGPRFVDVTHAAGLAYPAYPTQTADWGDYDGDGDLDVYIGNEASASSTNPLALFGQTGAPYPSQLFRNNGDGTFTDVARAAGVENRRFAKGVAWGDLDDDGDPDLYVSNIGPNRLYENRGDGTFRDVAAAAGVIEPADGTFATWFFDQDNDGDLDLLVARYSTPVPRISSHLFGQPVEDSNPVLYRNEGGRFVDVSAAAGLRSPVLAMGANYGDLDNDGWLDMYFGTGVPDFDALMPNKMFRNAAGRFEDVTSAGGFGHLQKGHGIAFGDIDGDGEQELFQQLGGAYPFDAFGNALYDNPGTPNAWVTLRLVGRKANRHGVGARIEVQVGTGESRRSIHTLVGAGSSFGGSSLQQEIGLGDARRIERITIRWPGSGTVQEFENIAINALYQADEAQPELERLPLQAIALGGHEASEHSHGSTQ